MADRSLAASNMGVALGTLASRVTGLLRLVVFAAVIGQTALADAFDVGNNAPNVVFELLLGGTLTAALVPLFVQHQQRNDREATAAVFGAALLGATVITAVAVIAAPLIFRVYALSPVGDADAFYRVGTALTRVFLVQIFFYALNALVAALLNARDKFFAAAWAPVASNMVAIAALVAIWRAHTGGVVDLADADVGSSIFWWFSLGPTLGIALMAGVVLAAGIRSGAVPLPRLKLRNPAVRQLLTLSGWAIGYIAANQVALV
ncbi:MAG: lipid II flippase MurJ, partial [Ilumatobacteraceae bacterium]